MTEPSQRLERPADGRVVAGVAAALGNRFGVSPWLPRVAFAILAFFGGFGILLYALGWLLIPKQGLENSIVGDWISDLETPESWLGAVLIGVGVLIVIAWLGFTQNELIWAAALLIAGILLYRGDIKLPARDQKRDESGAIEREASPDKEAPPPPRTPATPTAQPPDPKRKPRSILGRLTFAAVLITVGVMALLDSADIIFPSARHYLAAALTVTGLGLVVGAWYGRSRALIVLGIVVLPFAFLAAAIGDVRFDGRMGEHTFAPESVSFVQDEYRVGAGDLTVDLRRIEPGIGTIPVRAYVGAGEVTVIVPRGAGVQATGRVGIGEVSVLGETEAGIDRLLRVVQAGSPSTGSFEVFAEAGFGSVQIIMRNP